MAKVIKLTMGGDLVYPATIGEAIVVDGEILTPTIRQLKKDTKGIEDLLDNILEGNEELESLLDRLNS